MAISKKIAAFMSNGSWIRKMFEEGNRLKAAVGADKVFDFTLGNPVLPPPDEVKAELRRLVAEDRAGGHGYMHNAGYLEVRQKVADYLNKLYELGFKGEHVIMTTGAGGGLNVLLKSILDPGDEVIIVAPYFVEYFYYVDNHGGQVVKVCAGKDFDLNVAAIAEKIGEKTKAVLICSPNNPTGRVYSAETLEALGKALEAKQEALKKTIFLINDEPYRKIIFDGLDFPSHMHHYANSILVNSHSKDFSIPGERIGYVAVNPKLTDHKDLIDAMTFSNRVLGFVNAPALWQRVAGVCQEASVNVGWYQERRNLLYNGLREIGYEVVKPQGAFYIFPRCPIDDDVEFTQAATRHNLLVVPGSGFGTPGYFRISYCTASPQMIQKALPIFAQLYREFKAG